MKASFSLLFIIMAIFDDLYTCISLSIFPCDLQAVVYRTVIHNDQFKIGKGLSKYAIHSRRRCFSPSFTALITLTLRGFRDAILIITGCHYGFPTTTPGKETSIFEQQVIVDTVQESVLLVNCAERCWMSMCEQQPVPNLFLITKNR